MTYTRLAFETNIHTIAMDTPEASALRRPEGHGPTLRGARGAGGWGGETPNGCFLTGLTIRL